MSYMINNVHKEKILEFITSSCEKNGIPPTVREIAKAVGLKSTSSVHRYVSMLQEDGRLNKSDNKKRCVTPKNVEKIFNIPIIGKVTAGYPILATENFEGYLPFPASGMKNGEHFALIVKGNSMKKCGILDGDTVIVRQTNYAENGDIVVALLGEEATVKRFYKENGFFRLQPENDDFDPIITKELEILGKIIASVRYYY